MIKPCAEPVTELLTFHDGMIGKLVQRVPLYFCANYDTFVCSWPVSGSHIVEAKVVCSGRAAAGTQNNAYRFYLMLLYCMVRYLSPRTRTIRHQQHT